MANRFRKALIVLLSTTIMIGSSALNSSPALASGGNGGANLTFDINIEKADGTAVAVTKTRGTATVTKKGALLGKGDEFVIWTSLDGFPVTQNDSDPWCLGMLSLNYVYPKGEISPLSSGILKGKSAYHDLSVAKIATDGMHLMDTTTYPTNIYEQFKLTYDAPTSMDNSASLVSGVRNGKAFGVKFRVEAAAGETVTIKVPADNGDKRTANVFGSQLVNQDNFSDWNREYEFSFVVAKPMIAGLSFDLGVEKLDGSSVAVTSTKGGHTSTIGGAALRKGDEFVVWTSLQGFPATQTDSDPLCLGMLSLNLVYPKNTLAAIPEVLKGKPSYDAPSVARISTSDMHLIDPITYPVASYDNYKFTYDVPTGMDKATSLVSGVRNGKAYGIKFKVEAAEGETVTIVCPSDKGDKRTVNVFAESSINQRDFSDWNEEFAFSFTVAPPAEIIKDVFTFEPSPDNPTEESRSIPKIFGKEVVPDSGVYEVVGAGTVSEPYVAEYLNYMELPKTINTTQPGSLLRGTETALTWVVEHIAVSLDGTLEGEVRKSVIGDASWNANYEPYLNAKVRNIGAGSGAKLVLYNPSYSLLLKKPGVTVAPSAYAIVALKTTVNGVEESIYINLRIVCYGDVDGSFTTGNLDYNQAKGKLITATGEFNVDSLLLADLDFSGTLGNPDYNKFKGVIITATEAFETDAK